MCIEIIARQDGEELVIGGNITVKVLSTTDRWAVLAVTRPAEISVFRAEEVARQPSLAPWYRQQPV